MMIRVTLSAAVSVDGYIDDVGSERLLLSNAEDFAAIDRLRAEHDAILVGAGTLRADNPRLTIRDPNLREARRARGWSLDPVKITLTKGDLNPSLRFFTEGEGCKWVYAPTSAVDRLQTRLQATAEVRAGGPSEVDLNVMLHDLERRGIQTLMVEGGTTVSGWFLRENRVHRLRLAVAPFFVGQHEAPRWVGPGRFPFDLNRRMKLQKLEALGDVSVLHYELNP